MRVVVCREKKTTASFEEEVERTDGVGRTFSSSYFVDGVLSNFVVARTPRFFRNNVAEMGAGAEWLRPEHQKRAPSPYLRLCV